jgi:hypothetical protein
MHQGRSLMQKVEFPLFVVFETFKVVMLSLWLSIGFAKAVLL